MGSYRLVWVPIGSYGFLWVLKPGRTRMDPDGPGRTRTDLDGPRWTWLGFAGFYYTDVFNDRLLGAILQLVPGCYTLAA